MLPNPSPRTAGLTDGRSDRLLADLFRLYQIEFRRMVHMTKAEMEQATIPQ
jgi:hypothetical protein